MDKSKYVDRVSPLVVGIGILDAKTNSSHLWQSTVYLNVHYIDIIYTTNNRRGEEMGSLHILPF
ncbi:hypothetical protein PILCRDRAFT_244885 [Piloderma croceum F 1598]|uniref:Uncharacterized protein n=1 Tax=Piloderma croceum (strain F 1598) TaxID=765440 RepID=A0A0C3GE54_PILCF|nr:hypothetical protein PILCRDRAFT_244885 [Piloderma croceum F 1598]